MNKQDITIAIMFFNKPEQTVECLESFKDFNILLLDNGSCPEAFHIIDEYTHERPNITLMSVTENIGVAKGRNLMIKSINTEWIFFVDNDITVQPTDWFEIFKMKAFLYPHIQAFVPTIHNIHLGRWEPLYVFEFKDNKVSWKIHGGASLVKKELFDVIGMYDEDFFVGFEDYEFAIRAWKMGKELRVLKISNIVANHDHRKAIHDYDNEYLQTRYNAEHIKHSYDLIKEKHGITLPDDGVKWSQNQIKLMEK